MTTAAIFAHGTLIKMGDGGSPESFTTIAEARAISGPNITAAVLDATTHDSAGWMEKVAGLLNAGQVSFQVMFRPLATTHGYTAGILKKLVNKTRTNFQLVFPDGSSTTWTFLAIVTGFNSTEPHDGLMTANITLEISGAPTLA